MARYAVIDFETTGLSPAQGDRALEIAAVIVDANRIVDSFQTLINPGIPVSPFITSLTGITNEMIAPAPPPHVAMRDAARFVHGVPLVAHNAAFDRRFWSAELDQLGVSAGNAWLCTLRIARRLYPGASDYQLGTLSDLLYIDFDGRHHRALADAMVAAQLLLRMTEDLKSLYRDREIDFAFLDAYQSAPKKKVLKVNAGAGKSNVKWPKPAASMAASPPFPGASSKSITPPSTTVGSMELRSAHPKMEPTPLPQPSQIPKSQELSSSVPWWWIAAGIAAACWWLLG